MNFKVAIPLMMLAGIEVSAAVEESQNPVRLRDRLIDVEKTFVQHSKRMEKQDKEVASLIMRIKHLEQMLYQQGPIVLDEASGGKGGSMPRKEKIRPYRFN